jgi:hypothetical protein
MLMSRRAEHAAGAEKHLESEKPRAYVDAINFSTLLKSLLTHLNLTNGYTFFASSFLENGNISHTPHTTHTHTLSLSPFSVQCL